MTPSRFFMFLLPVGSLFACAAQTPPASPPPDITPIEPPTLPQPAPAGAVRTIELDVGNDFAQCPLAQPHFAFDESQARLMDSDELREFADCISQPELRHLDLVLTGRTDPEGSEQYNQELGKSRADYVRDKLVDYGVDKDRITVRSAGESGATPEDDDIASHGYDRRVDIVQLGVVHAPTDAP